MTPTMLLKALAQAVVFFIVGYVLIVFAIVAGTPA